MFKKILVPLDFSRKNLSAVRAACRLARQNKGRVFLIHIIETIEQISGDELKDFYSKLESNAQKKMTQFSKLAARYGVSTEKIILYGHRTAELLKYSAVNNFDLIVMSSHKVQPGRGWSTLSYQVAILAPCPTLLIK